MNMLSAKVKSGVATSSSRLRRDARFDLKVQNAASVARRAPSPVRLCESERFFFFGGWGGRKARERQEAAELNQTKAATPARRGLSVAATIRGDKWSVNVP